MLRPLFRPLQGLLPGEEGVVWEDAKRNEASGDDSVSEKTTGEDDKEEPTQGAVVSTYEQPSAPSIEETFNFLDPFPPVPANAPVPPETVLPSTPTSWPEESRPLLYFYCPCGNWHAWRRRCRLSALLKGAIASYHGSCTSEVGRDDSVSASLDIYANRGVMRSTGPRRFPAAYEGEPILYGQFYRYSQPIFS